MNRHVYGIGEGKKVEQAHRLLKFTGGLKTEESMSTAERIFKEAQKLPDTLAQEVLDFIEYIEIKHGLRDRLTEELKQAQEPAMRHVWDNEDDEVWNGV